MSADVSRNNSQSTEKGCTSDEIDGMKGEKEVGNIGSEYETLGNECETEDQNCEDIEAETDDRNGKQVESVEAE
jgi:hypothetical protein